MATNKPNQTTINIGIGTNTNIGSLVELESKIQHYNLRIGDILKPGMRSAKTLARITCHVKELCERDPTKISLLPDLIQLAYQAKEQGNTDGGIPLFVHKAKQLTGFTVKHEERTTNNKTPH